MGERTQEIEQLRGYIGKIVSERDGYSNEALVACDSWMSTPPGNESMVVWIGWAIYTAAEEEFHRNLRERMLQAEYVASERIRKLNESYDESPSALGARSRGVL
jgi:hypothetical protein